MAVEPTGSENSKSPLFCVPIRIPVPAPGPNVEKLDIDTQSPAN